MDSKECVIKYKTLPLQDKHSTIHFLKTKLLSKYLTFPICVLVITLSCRKPNVKRDMINNNPKTEVINIPLLNYQGLYIDNLNNWYNKSDSVTAVLNFCLNNTFHVMTEYDLTEILNSKKNYASIAKFNEEAKTIYGIKQITCVVGDSADFAKYMIPFDKAQTDSQAKFNYVNLESEWWNDDCTWAQYAKKLRAIQKMGRQQNPIVKTELYIGWLENPDGEGLEMCDTLVKYADRILVHDYYPAPSWGYVRSRLDTLGRAAISQNKVETIVIIFNVDDALPYFQDNNTFADAYSIIQNSYDTTNMAGKNGIQLIGYQIFCQSEARLYDTKSQEILVAEKVLTTK
jgi:hypothetical protein